MRLNEFEKRGVREGERERERERELEEREWKSEKTDASVQKLKV